MIDGPRRYLAGRRPKAITTASTGLFEPAHVHVLDRARARTSEWCTLTSEEEDECEFRQKRIRTDRQLIGESAAPVRPVRGPGWMLD